MIYIPVDIKVENTGGGCISIEPVFSNNRYPDGLYMMSDSLLESTIIYDISKFPFYILKGYMMYRDNTDYEQAITVEIMKGIINDKECNRSSIRRHIYNLYVGLYNTVNKITGGDSDILDDITERFIYSMAHYFGATDIYKIEGSNGFKVPYLLFKKVTWIYIYELIKPMHLFKLSDNVINSVLPYLNMVYTFSPILYRDYYSENDYNKLKIYYVSELTPILSSCIEAAFMYDSIILSHSFVNNEPLLKSTMYISGPSGYDSVRAIAHSKESGENVLVCMCNRNHHIIEPISNKNISYIPSGDLISEFSETPFLYKQTKRT